jgi:tetratricopeptide (TPR) repeat protein
MAQPGNRTGWLYYNPEFELKRLSTPAPAPAGGKDSALTRCASAETAPAAAIVACTAVLSGGSESVRNTAVALSRRGLAYLASGDDDRAVGDLSAALALDSANAGALRGRALVSIRKGQIDPAIEDLSRALAFDPKFADALALRGAAYLRKGQTYQALADFNAAISLAPETPGALFGRGVVKHRMGDVAGGQADMASAIRLKPDIAAEQGKLGIKLEN